MIKYKDKAVIALFSLFILLLFYYISKLTPLAGDDWGYAVIGRDSSNVFAEAFSFYFSWSGRFFSELWGFIVPYRKWLWNILNPIMFVVIFLSIINLFKKSKNLILICFITLFLMLSIQNTLRIETYTWIMGSTYVVPLMLILIYINIVKKVLFDTNKISKVETFICIFLNFYISLCIENISAIQVVLNILICVYLYFNNKKLLKNFIYILLVSIVGLAILRLSPGSNYRLHREHLDFVKLSLFEKIAHNYNDFLKLTFIENNYLMFIFSLIFIVFNIKLISKNKVLAILFILFGVIGVFTSISKLMYLKTDINILRIFFDIDYSKGAFIYCSVFYLFTVVFTFISLFIQFKDNLLNEGITYLLLAGGSNIVMLISPIFGARSSLYTVYFLIVFICFIVSCLDIKLDKICCLLLFLLIMLKSREYVYKYKTIAYIQQIRDMEIEYYKNNPDEKEAWLIRMPKSYIHSADIEEDDVYHMEVFKKYYGLNPKMKLIFYNK